MSRSIATVNSPDVHVGHEGRPQDGNGRATWRVDCPDLARGLDQIADGWATLVVVGMTEVKEVVELLKRSGRSDLV